MTGPEAAEDSLASTIWDGLPDEARTLLATLRGLTAPGARVALVGGAVRDPLLGVVSAAPDLDVVAQDADVEVIAGEWARATGSSFSWHPAYRNATLHLDGAQPVDVVSARRETYPAPGAQPVPEPGTLEDDLARRDFTINALALELRPDGTQRLLTVPHALDDLHARTLRPLHSRSFRDDASRLVRAARLAGRLGLHAHTQVLAQVPDALAVAAQTPRLWAELRLLLDEPQPGQAAWALEQWGATELLPPGAAGLLERLDALPGPHGRTVYAAALLSLDPAALELLALGPRPAELLARARSGLPAAPGSPEATLQALLHLAPPYVPVQGRDLLQLGLTPGPRLGELLGWLAAGRRAGRFGSRQDELDAVRARLAE